MSFWVRKSFKLWFLKGDLAPACDQWVWAMNVPICDPGSGLHRDKLFYARLLLCANWNRFYLTVREYTYTHMMDRTLKSDENGPRKRKKKMKMRKVAWIPVCGGKMRRRVLHHSVFGGGKSGKEHSTSKQGQYKNKQLRGIEVESTVQRALPSCHLLFIRKGAVPQLNM